MSQARGLSAVALGAALVACVEAQADEAAEAGAGVIVYTAADFAAARPNTALDLVRRLPGFAIDSGDDVRGFAGAAGNVLIDGQRPTSKTDDVDDILERIPIGQVERVELIRGGATGIDMQGRSVVANVVRKTADAFQQVVSVGNLTYLDTGKNLPTWSYQATLNRGGRQFDFELSRARSYDDSVGSGARRTAYADGTALEQFTGTEADGAVHTAKATYKGLLLGGKLSVNGLVSADNFKDESHFYGAPQAEHYVGRSSNQRGELGVNYTRGLGAKFEIETLGLYKIAAGEGRNTGDDGVETSAFAVDAEAGESIGRSVLRWRPVERLTIEGGGEVAFNYRDQQVALQIDGQGVPLPASDVRVEEVRGESFAQAVWRTSERLSLEAGIRVEESTISQSGDTNLERSFVYAKPRATLSWSPSEGEQIRLRVEREVGQLNFRDFVSSVSLGESGRVQAGNLNLEPDKLWAYEAVFETRFWAGAAAVLTLRHEDITDVVDLKPFEVTTDDADGDGQPDTQLVAGPGNIGDGRNDVLALNLTLPLARLGLKGAEIKLDASYENSEVTDPLTGEARRISGQRPQEIEARFRHDLPKRKITYGFGYFGGWSERSYYLEEEQHLWLKDYYYAFVEYKPTPQLTLSADLDNFDPYRFYIERTAYDAPRNTGDLAFVQTERRDSQVLLTLGARLQFGG